MLDALTQGGNGKLAKASLLVFDGGEGTPPTSLDVQFNPSEYTITRGVNLSEKTGDGQQANPQDVQVTSGALSTLSVTLYFDAFTDLKSLGVMDVVGAVSNVASNPMELLKTLGQVVMPDLHAEVNDLCNKVATTIRYVSSLHQPPVVRFVWGQGIQFEGIVQSSTINYTMFAPNGTPVRMKMVLKIVGEELELLQEDASAPFESPDRTKERFLPYGDQLWMVAADEYGDPNEWKVIAQANGILNPRAIGRAVRLKVPAIR